MQNIPNLIIIQTMTNDEQYARFRTIEVSKGREYALKLLPANGGDEYIYESTNAKIKKLRTDNELTQKELADVLKLSQREYWRYEKEGYSVNIFKLAQIAVFYNVSIDWLSGFHPEPKAFYADIEKTRVNGYSLSEMKEAKSKGEKYKPKLTEEDEYTQKKLEWR